MARTVEEIRQNTTDIYVGNMAAIGVVVDPKKWSSTNLQRLLIYVFSFCAVMLENIYDKFTADNNAAIAKLKPHTIRWYASIALAFQSGFNLLPDSDEFDNIGKTDDEIEDSKIVDYAAVVEQTNAYGRVYLRLKLAHDNGDDLEPLTTDQLTSFNAYMQLVKDAGVPLIITSNEPDSIKQSWRIFYNPLILNSNGERIDGSDNTPVQSAIKNRLKHLPFNGIYAPQNHIDVVQQVEGVVLCALDSCETQYGLLPFSEVADTYTPDSGYLRFDTNDDLQIQFIAKAPIE